MKKILFCLFILFIPFNVFCLDINTYSNNVILYNLNDNNILYEKNSESQVCIASLTKIMTGIVAIENINDLDEKVILEYDDFKGLAALNASQAGFDVFEEVTYRDLLYGLLLPSGADAAQALSRLIAGSVSEFVKLMNEKAALLELNNTHFMNTTGLDEEGHYSTVSDVSKLLMYAIKNEEFLNIIKTRYYTTSNNNHKFKSTIAKMQDLYNIHDMDYLIGGKTGTTGNAGLCLASIAEKNDVKYLLVTALAPISRDVPYNLLDAKNIYEYFINNYSYQNVLDVHDELIKIKTKYIKDDYLSFNSSRSVNLYLENKFNKSNLEYLYDGKKLITSDMKKGDKLGVVKIIYNGDVLAVEDIVLDKEINFDLGKYIKENKIISYVLCTISLVIITSVFCFIRKKIRFLK